MKYGVRHMLKIGIILLGISNLLSATIPTGMFMLIVISMMHQGFHIENIFILLIIFALEIIKWIAFYQIIKNDKIKWYSFYIVYSIPIIIVSINNPLYATLLLGYTLAFVALHLHRKSLVAA